MSVFGDIVVMVIVIMLVADLLRSEFDKDPPPPNGGYGLMTFEEIHELRVPPVSGGGQLSEDPVVIALLIIAELLCEMRDQARSAPSRRGPQNPVRTFSEEKA